MGNILSVNNLSIQLSERVLVRNISFTVNQGDVVLLSGANGIGKSTLLKSILQLETHGKKINGEINVHGFGNVLSLDESELQRLRSSIAYIQQRDDYAQMGSVQVKDIINECGDAFNGRTLTDSEINDLIDEWIPRRDNNSRIFDAKTKPAKFSGGEQRLLSVLSVIATRPNANLMIIDEPLNNLDFINARNISNIINRVIKANPNMGVLMISHCRIFPFITREIILSSDGITESSNPYFCHSCFGNPDLEGYYK